MAKSNLDKYVAEVVATFVLVFVGAGSVVVNGLGAEIGILGIALAHGLALMSMVYATSHISGAHINPAVTIAMFLAKRIDGRNAVSYIVSQLFGSAVAGLLLLTIFPQAAAGWHLGVTDLAVGLGVAKGILIEAVLTFFLVFTVFALAVDRRASSQHAALAIGAVLTFSVLIGGAFTGAALNPARAFGPALASFYWSNQLVYWIGPIIGAVVAGFIYRKLLLGK